MNIPTKETTIPGTITGFEKFLTAKPFKKTLVLKVLLFLN